MDVLGDIAWAAATLKIVGMVLAWLGAHPILAIAVSAPAGLVALHYTPGPVKLNGITSLALIAFLFVALILEGARMFMAPQPPAGPHRAAEPPTYAQPAAIPPEDRIGGP